MMQLFGHKVEYAESSITKDGVYENGRIWEKAAEELNGRRFMERKRKIAELKERIAKNGKISIQECKRTSYEYIPVCCECKEQ